MEKDKGIKLFHMMMYRCVSKYIDFCIMWQFGARMINSVQKTPSELGKHFNARQLQLGNKVFAYCSLDKSCFVRVFFMCSNFVHIPTFWVKESDQPTSAEKQVNPGAHKKVQRERGQTLGMEHRSTWAILFQWRL